MEKNMYLRFLLMLSCSFVVMYAVMYFNVASLDHIFLNLNRLYMTILMVAPMALIMFGFMHKMYKNKTLNTVIISVGILGFAASFWMLRQQTGVDDAGFIHSMTPHHSSAILVSEKADIQDPELKELSEEIIKTQKEEIAQMKRILERFDKK